MSPEETGRMRTAIEAQQDQYADEFEELLERLGDVPMGDFTLAEALVINRFGLADQFQFKPHFEAEDLELLRQAEMRIRRHRALRE
ncbi:MAG: hypothetical protein KBC02_02840 [Candidatus Pacebacteria bacterium]|nr:hypothetical protein [Candidatus Paceibacterota bacterium]